MPPTKKPANKRFLHIEGFQAQRTIFQTRVELAQLTEGDIKGLLRALAAKPPSLSYDQIVREYAQGRNNSPTHLLPLEEGAPSFAHGCGDNPVFTACVVDAEGD